MKTKEELNALKEEIESMNKILADLTEEELKQIFGGEMSESGYTVLACDRCGYEITWPGTGYRHWVHYGVNCEKCDSKSYHWVREVKGI